MNLYEQKQAQKELEHEAWLKRNNEIDLIIKPLPQCSGNTDIDLKYLKGQLEHYHADYGVELNPDFQRGHVWTQAQKISFIEAFIRGAVGTTGRTITFNCPDYRGTDKATDSDLDGMVCVDGLQRLSAILEYMRGDFKIFPALHGGVAYDYFNGTKYSFKGNSIKFQIFTMQYKRDVLEYYLAINDTGTPHSQAEIQRIQAMLSEF